MKLTGELRSTHRKTCLSATLSTINPTWTGLIFYPGVRGKNLATNCLNKGAATGVVEGGQEEFDKCA
jgi:hypothetical protein